jgi:hypothetical protein
MEGLSRPFILKSEVQAVLGRPRRGSSSRRHELINFEEDKHPSGPNIRMGCLPIVLKRVIPTLVLV